MRSTRWSILKMTTDTATGKITPQIMPSSTRYGRALAHLRRLRATAKADVKYKLSDKVSSAYYPITGSDGPRNVHHGR
jgi:hypothetical protein